MRQTSHKTRVIFIDLARALAVVFMLYGHTVDALLAPPYRTGFVFDIWQFQRGLTSCLFLLLSGFAFSIATARHWSSHLTISPALLRRIRRFLMFVLIGYAMHAPVAPLSRMSTDADWRAFLGVDVLQLIGVTFIVLAMAFRSIVVSLTAAVTTILSAFVGFGILTLVVQEGYLMRLTGLDRTGPIETFVPPMFVMTTEACPAPRLPLCDVVQMVAPVNLFKATTVFVSPPGVQISRSPSTRTDSL